MGLVTVAERGSSHHVAHRAGQSTGPCTAASRLARSIASRSTPPRARFARPVYSAATDAALLSQARSDPCAFQAVFVRHASAIHRYLARRVEPSAIEDLVAETFAVAFDQRARYRQEYPDARPWLFGIATNLARRHVRSERARVRAYARLDVAMAASATEIEAVARADARAVLGDLAAALRQLGQGDRDALLLMVWADLSYEEIARALAIPVGTVRSRINRARRRLRELLSGTGIHSCESRRHTAMMRVTAASQGSADGACR